MTTQRIMIARHVRWSEVEPWSIVRDPVTGLPAIVLPFRITEHTMSRPLIDNRGKMAWTAYRPDAPVTVLEPELGDAVRNLMQHFTIEEIPDGR